MTSEGLSTIIDSPPLIRWLNLLLPQHADAFHNVSENTRLACRSDHERSGSPGSLTLRNSAFTVSSWKMVGSGIRDTTS